MVWSLVTDRDRLRNDVFVYRKGQAPERCVWLQKGTGYGTMCLVRDRDRLGNVVFGYRQGQARERCVWLQTGTG